MQDYDKLVLGDYYSEDFLKHSGNIHNCRSINTLYGLEWTPDKSATDTDVISRNNPGKAVTDESNVYRIVHKGAVSQDVMLQDQTTAAVIAKFNQIQAGSTLAVETAINDRTITVTDATGFVIGHYVVMYSTVIDRYYLGYILDIDGNVLTVDTPLDSVFPVGAIVGVAITNMAVNGEETPQIFGLRGSPVENPLNLVFDVTRIIFYCITEDPVDLSKFADIAGGITNGLILRKRNGEYNNIFNVKTNGELAGIMYDFSVASSLNPAQGQNGFYCRLTFAGQNKLGVAIRLSEGEDLELIVQDDLTGITKLEVTAEGHVVDYGIYND